MLRRAGLLTAIICVVATLAAACTGGPDPASSATSGQSSEQTASSGGIAGSVSVTRPWGNDEVTIVVDPVQVADGVSLLRVAYSLPASASESVRLDVILGSPYLTEFGSAGVRLVDPARGTVSQVARDADGRFVESLEGSPLEPGASVVAQSVFAGATGDTIDVLVPGFGYVAAVPVVAAGDGFDAAVAALGEPVDAPTYALQTFAMADDATRSTAVRGDTVTMSLTSDVLFGSDSAALSDAAGDVIDAAVVSVQELADQGELLIVGHTDDVDTEEYNQQLSEDRAAAVADRVTAALGEGYSVTAQGRGEREPVVADTTEEARALNRRVEIIFTMTKDPDAPGGSTQALPPTELPTVGGDEQVEYRSNDESTVAVSVVEVERHGDALVGTVEVELVAGGWPSSGVLSPTSPEGRSFGWPTFVSGLHNVSLVSADGRTYPFDYVEGAGEDQVRRLLGDETLRAGSEDGGVVRLTYVWPDSGQDVVAIESLDAFRITDIPVTQSG